MDEELYKENILEHYRHPHNKRFMENPTHSGRGKNSTCGDDIQLFLKEESGVVVDISFTGSGCALSQAGASLLTDHLKGKKLNEVKMITPGTIYTLLGVNVSPGRSACALLSYEALEQMFKK